MKEDDNHFVFDIEPKPQLRTRAAFQHGHIHVYDPVVTRRFKKQLKELAKVKMAERAQQPFDGPLVVIIRVYRAMQKSTPKRDQLPKLNGKLRPFVKPDVSNFVKSVEDSFNGVLWKDDSLIVQEFSEKYYSQHPHIEIEVYNFDEITLIPERRKKAVTC